MCWHASRDPLSVALPPGASQEVHWMVGNKLSSYWVQNGTTNKTLGELQTQSAQVAEALENLSGKVDDLQDAHAKQVIGIAVLGAKFDGLTTKSVDNAKQLKIMDKDIAVFSSKVDVLKETVDVTDGKIDDLKDACAKQDTGIVVLSVKVDNLTTQNAQIAEQSKITDSKVDDLKAASATLGKDVAAFAARVDELEQQH